MPTRRQLREQVAAERTVQAASVAQRDAQYRRDVAAVLSRPMTREALIASLVPLVGAWVRFAFKAGREDAALEAEAARSRA